MCIKLVSIKELYYDARTTKSQKLNLCYSNDFVSKINDLKGIFVTFSYTQLGNKLHSPFREANKSSCSEVTRNLRNPKFIIVFTTTRYVFLSSKWIDSTARVPLRSILMLRFHLLVGTSSCLFSLRFLLKAVYTFSFTLFDTPFLTLDLITLSRSLTLNLLAPTTVGARIDP